MRLVCVRRSCWAMEAAPSAQLLDERAEWEHVHQHLPHADIIFLTCAQNEVTKGMVNEEVCWEGLLRCFLIAITASDCANRTVTRKS